MKKKKSKLMRNFGEKYRKKNLTSACARILMKSFCLYEEYSRKQFVLIKKFFYFVEIPAIQKRIWKHNWHDPEVKEKKFNSVLFFLIGILLIWIMLHFHIWTFKKFFFLTCFCFQFRKQNVIYQLSNLPKKYFLFISFDKILFYLFHIFCVSSVEIFSIYFFFFWYEIKQTSDRMHNLLLCSGFGDNVVVVVVVVVVFVDVDAGVVDEINCFASQYPTVFLYWIRGKKELFF